MNYTNDQYIEKAKELYSDKQILNSIIKGINNNDRGIKFLLNAKMK